MFSWATKGKGNLNFTRSNNSTILADFNFQGLFIKNGKLFTFAFLNSWSTRLSQKNGPLIFKNISSKSGLVHSFEEFLSKLFIKNQIEKCDLPNCFMCIMMKSPFFRGISQQNVFLKLRTGHSFETPW